MKVALVALLVLPLAAAHVCLIYPIQRGAISGLDVVGMVKSRRVLLCIIANLVTIIHGRQLPFLSWLNLWLVVDYVRLSTVT